MISKEEVQNLAALARLKLSDGEVANLQKDISSILDYVGQVSGVSEQGSTLLTSPHRNVMREDVPTETLGKRENLLAAFPKREGDFNVVRKIIDKDAE